MVGTLITLIKENLLTFNSNSLLHLLVILVQLNLTLST